MEINMLWDLILTMVIAPLGWFINTQHREIQRLQILLNMTREDYMKRSDYNDESDRVLEHLRRLEDKIDRIGERVK